MRPSRRCTRTSGSCSSRESTCRPRWSRGSATSRDCWARKANAMAPTQKLRTLHALLSDGESVGRFPWPRVVVGRDAWREAAALMRQGDCTLLGLWAQAHFVHLALIDEARNEPAILSFAAEGASYPSVAH